MIATFSFAYAGGLIVALLMAIPISIAAEFEDWSAPEFCAAIVLWPASGAVCLVVGIRRLARRARA